MTRTVTSWDPAPFRDQVQQVLDAFLDEREAELAPLGPDAGRLVAEARTAVRGGKRFVTRSVADAYPLGSGVGPVSTFWRISPRSY